MRRFHIVFFLVLLSLVGLTQHRREYLFTNYSTSNVGLATNLINSITQDENGYMWFATYNGLQRFDGNKFITFRNSSDNNKTIPHNNIKNLFFDNHNRLWLAGNDNRIGFFNTTQFSFKEISIQERKPETSYIPKHFFQTYNGQLLLYEEKGNIYRYDDKAVQFILYNDFIKLPPRWKQNHITWDSFQHKYWIACDSGLVLFNPANKRLSYRGHNIENDPVIKRFENEKGIANLLVNNNNTISFFVRYDTLYRLYYYNRNTGHATIENPGEKLGLNFFEIHGMFHQRNGRVWVHGVKLFAQWLPEEALFLPVSSFHNAEYKIKSNYVNIIFEDRESNLWVATDNGLFLFNPDGQLFSSHRLAHPMEKPKDEEDVLTMSTFQTMDENIYIGSWQKGLFIYDKHFNPKQLPSALQALTKYLTIWGIHEHSKTGMLWFSIEDQGNRKLAIYNPKRGTIEWLTNPVFEGSPIINFEEDKEGNLWMGTKGGHLVKWNLQLETRNINKGFVLISKVSGSVRETYKDQTGYIWAVTTKSGLLRIDPKRNSIVRNYTEASGSDQLSSGIVDLLQYNDSILVVATETNLNLIHLKTNTITSISIADGLPANTIRTIQKDKQGILWLGLLGGICRANLEKKTFTIYDRKDGIPYDNFVSVRGLLLRDGQLVFSTSENLLIIDPSKAVQSVRPSPPVITSFHLANKPLSIDSLLKQEVKLNYDNSSISIGFSNLSFLKEKKQRYYYMMEGLDKDWVHADATKQAQYNYIQPGTYTFHVKSVNEDGIASSDFATLKIVVKPPFWKTGLFYGILAILGLLGLFLIDRERLKRLREVQQMRSQIAVDLHKDIHVTLSDINILSAMAKIKADKDIDRSKGYIDTISAKSRDILESMEDILWTLTPENDSMKKMLLRIQEYTDGISNSQKASIELKSSNSIKDLVLNMRSRHEFLLFYKHALSLIIQKAHHYPTILITLEYVKGKLTLTMDAHSNDWEEESLDTHLSEEEMYKRADALNAKLDIKAEQQHFGILLQLNA